MLDTTKSKDFFVFNKILSLGAPSYVTRSADEVLFESILDGQLCCVFASNGMGKSSLIVRTAGRLEQHGTHTAAISLSGISADINREWLDQWLMKRIKSELDLGVDTESWWANRTWQKPGQALVDFLVEVVLEEVDGSVVIFLDEVNHNMIELDCLADLFKAIRIIYSERNSNPNFGRLTFALVGVTTRADLEKAHDLAPFTTGNQIDLHDFGPEGTCLFKQRLHSIFQDQSEVILDRVTYWTNGHPYLTQKLCSNVAEYQNRRWDEAQVDRLVETLFLSAAAHHEPMLQFVRAGIHINPRREKLLRLYRRVLEGEHVAAEEQSPDQDWLKLLGLVRVENGLLKVHNEIYRRAFDLKWLKESTPLNRKLSFTIVSVLLILLLAGVIGAYVFIERQRAIEAQVRIEDISSATNADERLASLAGLFNLSGYEDEARQVFYGELASADQLALFNLNNPGAMEKELVTVIRGLITDPNLINSEQNNIMLEAMTHPLNEIKSSSTGGSFELAVEVSQWLNGREYYRSEGEYAKAIAAYDVAIRMNDSNPSTYFDRGLAYIRLGRPALALSDFVTVTNLDESWLPKIQQVLNDNPELHLSLWADQGNFQPLVALVPTPTGTPTLTTTPTPSPTPTQTNTPLPPTAIPTESPTATSIALPARPPAAATEVSTPADSPTPTPGIPVGRFTLITPASLNSPSYGPTTFEWEWSGQLPSEFGFEVRVWRDGSFPTGVHNALLDNQNGNVKNIGGNKYSLSTNITDSPGIEGKSGEYLWTVALVRISPKYADLAQDADPGLLRFAAPGSSSGGSGGGEDGGDSSGGGVGID